MLYKWSEKEGDKATYRKLAEMFTKCEMHNIVDEINRPVTFGTGEGMRDVYKDNKTYEFISLIYRFQLLGGQKEFTAVHASEL